MNDYYSLIVTSFETPDDGEDSGDSCHISYDFFVGDTNISFDISVSDDGFFNPEKIQDMLEKLKQHLILGMKQLNIELNLFDI
jgi:hypothetical protein